jgi:hypothetical protein
MDGIPEMSDFGSEESGSDDLPLRTGDGLNRNHAQNKLD